MEQSSGAPYRRRSSWLLLGKLVAAIALRVQERGEIAIVDARGGSLCDQRFGPECDAEAGLTDHFQVISAVACDQGLVAGKAELAAQFPERLKLGVTPQHRLLDLTQKAPVIPDEEAVAAVLVKADQRRDPRREHREPA